MKIIEGDITDLEMLHSHGIGAIVQGCNIRQVMGAGLALTVKNKFPEAYKADMEYPFEHPQEKLGKYSVGVVEYLPLQSYFTNTLMIGNLYQQDLYPTEEGNNLQPEKLYQSLSSFAEEFKGKRIAVPWMIGCGLAGGNFEEVRVKVEEILKNKDAVWVKYNG